MKGIWDASNDALKREFAPRVGFKQAFKDEFNIGAKKKKKRVGFKQAFKDEFGRKRKKRKSSWDFDFRI